MLYKIPLYTKPIETVSLFASIETEPKKENETTEIEPGFELQKNLQFKNYLAPFRRDYFTEIDWNLSKKNTQ